MPRARASALVALALVAGGCSRGGPDAGPSPTPSASVLPSPSVSSSSPPLATASPTASASASASASVSPTARPSASPTAPPAPTCSVVRGSRSVNDSFRAAVAFVSPTTGVIGAGRSLFRTTDGGLTWRRVRSLGGSVFDVVPAGCRVLFVSYAGPTGANIERSDDGGATWRPVLTAGPALHALNFVTPRVGFGLEPFPGEEPGGTIWKTYDGGAHWRRIAQPGDAVFTVAASIGGRTLAGLNNGVARSDDGGATWRMVVTRPERNWHTRVWLGSGSATGFATMGVQGMQTYRVYRSANLTTWSQVDSTGTGKIRGIPTALGGRGTASLMVGAFAPGEVILATTTNGGSTFRRRVVMDEGEGGDVVFGISGIAWNDATRAVAVIGSEDTATVYRTTDGGATWRYVRLIEG